jgi:hypothetical protein
MRANGEAPAVASAARGAPRHPSETAGPTFKAALAKCRPIAIAALRASGVATTRTGH